MHTMSKLRKYPLPRMSVIQMLDFTENVCYSDARLDFLRRNNFLGPYLLV